MTQIVENLGPLLRSVYVGLRLLRQCLDSQFSAWGIFSAYPPVTRDVYYAVALFLQLRTMYAELIQQHRGAGSLLLTPRLDTQATFAKLFADIGVEGDVRYAQILLSPHGMCFFWLRRLDRSIAVGYRKESTTKNCAR